MKTFGKKIRELRLGKNMRQADVIQQINLIYNRNISKSMYSKWERDLETPRKFQDVAALAQYFKVSADYLIGITNDKYKEEKNGKHPKTT